MEIFGFLEYPHHIFEIFFEFTLTALKLTWLQLKFENCAIAGAN